MSKEGSVELEGEKSVSELVKTSQLATYFCHQHSNLHDQIDI